MDAPWLVRTKEADEDDNVEQEVVIVGTDIKGPTRVDFAEFEAADGDDSPGVERP